MATLSLDHVSKIYSPKPRAAVRAVNDVNLHVHDGEIVALLGSSGCGKTSTLRMIAGLETISEGEIRIGDQVVNDLRPAERSVAMGFEGYALSPPLKISDNIGFALLRDRQPKDQVARTVRHIAELLDIESILDRYPPTISGGQQQRVSLARALARKASLHLLDEPMSQLEPQLRAVLRARIKDYLIEHRMTTVFVTHDQTEAMALADRIAVMEGGLLQQFGSPSDLKNRPANLFVASFVGEPPMSLMEAEVAGQGAAKTLVALDHAGNRAFMVPVPQDTAAGRLLPDGRKVWLGIRPHRVRLTPDAADTAFPIRGMLISNQWLGDQSHLGVDINGCFVIAVTDRSVPAQVDREITLHLPAEALHVFDAESGRALLHGFQPAG